MFNRVANRVSYERKRHNLHIKYKIFSIIEIIPTLGY
jgi:hypothetical protein